MKIFTSFCALWISMKIDHSDGDTIREEFLVKFPRGQEIFFKIKCRSDCHLNQLYVGTNAGKLASLIGWIVKSNGESEFICSDVTKPGSNTETLHCNPDNGIPAKEVYLSVVPLVSNTKVYVACDSDNYGTTDLIGDPRNKPTNLRETFVENYRRGQEIFFKISCSPDCHLNLLFAGTNAGKLASLDGWIVKSNGESQYICSVVMKSDSNTRTLHCIPDDKGIPAKEVYLSVVAFVNNTKVYVEYDFDNLKGTNLIDDPGNRPTNPIRQPSVIVTNVGSLFRGRKRAYEVQCGGKYCRGMKISVTFTGRGIYLQGGPGYGYSHEGYYCTGSNHGSPQECFFEHRVPPSQFLLKMRCSPVSCRDLKLTVTGENVWSVTIYTPKLPPWQQPQP